MSRITARTQRALREALVGGGTVGGIADLFQDEGFEPADEPRKAVNGQRRELVERYYASIDWSSPQQTAGVLRVFETALSQLGQFPGLEQQVLEIERFLALDGFSRDRLGRLVCSEAVALPSDALANLKDPSSIRQHLDRLAGIMDNDPEGAIGTAKELIESTAKLVLDTLGEEWSDGSDLPSLVRQAQKALQLHPDAVAPDRRGAPSIKTILGGLAAVAIGVAELRNLYGTGHGRRGRHPGLKPRHAHLAVGSATVYCRLILETLDDPDAPWRATVTR
ncbi:MAG: abortive infection family protein [Armatimonadetes bacterium]|nr:abortive infection family protein [Armatimonadota bacterium]